MNPSMGQQNMGNMQGQSGGGAMMFNQQMQMIQHARESADESQPAENDANADYAEQLEAIAASGFEGELIPWVGDKVPCVLRSSASDPTTTQPEMHAQNGRMILNKNSKFKENWFTGFDLIHYWLVVFFLLQLRNLFFWIRFHRFLRKLEDGKIDHCTWNQEHYHFQ
jgi:hypothetical protein